MTAFRTTANPTTWWQYTADRRLYTLLLRFTVPFWAIGILTPLQAVTIAWLAFSRSPQRGLPRLVAGSWMAIGFCQYISAVLAGVWRYDTAVGLGQIVSFGVIGWIMGGLAIWAGAAHGLSGAPVVRAVSKLGAAIIPLSLIGVVGVSLGLPSMISFYTLPILIAPDSISAKLYGLAAIYISEETFGETATRLILFFPYTTALGLGGIGIVMISLLEKDWRFRLAGLTGGLIAVVFSWSRLALGALLLCGLGWLWLKASLRLRLLLVFIALLGLFVMSVANVDWLTVLLSLPDRIDGVRAGSSIARHLIYDKSWEGFLESPLFGYGWIGPSVHPKEVLPIGSHSSVYGLLYTGGLLTFACFAIAMATTVLAGIIRLVRAGPDRRDEAIVMLLLSLTLLFFCKYESLFSVTLPCSYIFAFIGGALAPDAKRCEALTALPHDSGR